MQHPDPNPPNVTILSPNEPLVPEPPVTAKELPESEAEVVAAPRPRKPRGFATMDRARVIEIARKGGRAAHTAGTAHEFTTDEAREAGRKGGKAMHENRRRRRDAAAQH